MPLWPHQVRALGEEAQARAAGARVVAMVGPTGCGKTALAAEWARRRGGSGVWVAHRGELVSQAEKALARVGVHARVVTIQSYLDGLPSGDWHVLDECFPAGTLVDGRPIETIQLGDHVLSVDHRTGDVTRRRVVRRFYRGTCSLFEITTSDGRKLKCTGNHPIYRMRDEETRYTKAKDLEVGDLLCVWRDIHVREGIRGDIEADLFRRVQIQHLLQEDGGDQPSIRETETTWPQVDGRRERASRYHHDSKGTSTDDARREWSRPYAAGAGIGRRPRHENECGHRNWEEAPGDPNQLQDRCGRSDDKSCDRGRWIQSQQAAHSALRPEEGKVLTWARVDRVSRIEPRGGRRVAVYNLEVEGSHTYFADGILVHNCHHMYGSEKWSAAIAPARNGPTISLTATPERTDGAPLGSLADAIVTIAQPRELIAAGVLTPCEVIAGHQATKHLTDYPWDAYLKHGNKRKAIAFCTQVTYAEEVSSELRARGVRSACVHGALPWDQRRDILEQHAEGILQVVTSRDVLIEGYDDPTVSCAIVARRFPSAGAWIQAVGRAVRASPGKTRAVIIDLHGNIWMWGSPEADRHYSLDGTAITIDEDASEAQRQCKACQRVFLSKAFIDGVCPRCGTKPDPREIADPKVIVEEIARVSFEQLNDDQLKWLAAARKQATERGFKPGWVAWQFRNKYGCWPPADLGRSPQEIAKDPPDVKRSFYEKMKALAAEKGYKAGFAKMRFKQRYNIWPPRGWDQP